MDGCLMVHWALRLGLLCDYFGVHRPTLQCQSLTCRGHDGKQCGGGGEVGKRVGASALPCICCMCGSPVILPFELPQLQAPINTADTAPGPTPHPLRPSTSPTLETTSQYPVLHAGVTPNETHSSSYPPARTAMLKQF